MNRAVTGIWISLLLYHISVHLVKICTDLCDLFVAIFPYHEFSIRHNYLHNYLVININLDTWLVRFLPEANYVEAAPSCISVSKSIASSINALIFFSVLFSFESLLSFSWPNCFFFFYNYYVLYKVVCCLIFMFYCDILHLYANSNFIK